MNAKELKANIYEMLESTDDNLVLEDIQAYVSRRREGYAEELGCTIEEYNKELDDADAEIARGEFVSHEELRKEVDEMFRKLKNEA